MIPSNVVGTAVEVAATGAGVVAKASSVLGWLPWALAAASLVAGSGGTLWYRMQWKDCEASVAIDAAKAEEKVRAQKESDAKFTRELAEALKPITSKIQEEANGTREALAKVKSDPNCKATPAASAFDAGVVRPPGAEANPRPPRPARP